jgi:hypothetical protein
LLYGLNELIMELILKSNNEQSLAKIIALAKSLNVVVEKTNTDIDRNEKTVIKNRILNFKPTAPSSFGDAQQWEREQREDRDLPFA